MDPVGRFKNKHVRMAQHYTQELVVEGVILPVTVASVDNTADVATERRRTVRCGYLADFARK